MHVGIASILSGSWAWRWNVELALIHKKSDFMTAGNDEGEKITCAMRLCVFLFVLEYHQVHTLC